MIYSALSTHTGLVANEPYRKGLALQRAHSSRRAPGTPRLERHASRSAATAAWRSCSRTATAAPSPASRSKPSLGRPSTNRHDIKLKLAESAPGRYETQTAPLGEGSWLIAAEARIDARAEDPVYRTRRRLWLKP